MSMLSDNSRYRVDISRLPIATHYELADRSGAIVVIDKWVSVDHYPYFEIISINAYAAMWS